MWYILVVVISVVLGVRLANRLERQDKFWPWRTRWSWASYAVYYTLLLSALFSPVVFDYQWRYAPPEGGLSLYVENSDGSVTQPFFGQFHKPFASAGERATFRFDAGNQFTNWNNDAVFIGTKDGETRIVSFVPSWRYDLTPMQYRNLTRASNLEENAWTYFDAGHLGLVFAVQENQHEEVLNLLFAKTGDRYEISDGICLALPKFLDEHVPMPYPWMKHGVEGCSARIVN